jgi:uncharacterized protein YdhG (YjbR/CyaY superfamily)
MPMTKSNYKTIDEYISLFPQDVQKILGDIRQMISELVPEGSEAISYGMPTIKYKGKNLVHFAAFKHHIGFYPTPRPIVEFEKELVPYIHAKGSIQFPLDKPIPMELIRRIIEFRLKSFK